MRKNLSQIEDLPKISIMKEKQEYIERIKEVQTTGNWNKWIFYFVGVLFDIVRKREKQIDLIIKLKNQVIKASKLNDADLFVLNKYFKFIALKKSATISKLKTTEFHTPKLIDLLKKLQH